MSAGGHERTITHAGLRNALPANIVLIPGPGCPVCVFPEEDIYHAIELAKNPDVTLVAFGDMLRVPANVPKGEARTLMQARAQGGDVRPVASPDEALRLAYALPSRQVVFFAAGFETTMAPLATMIAKNAVPETFSILLSGRRTWPAVASLLESEGGIPFDALIAPGHVSTIMGAQEWDFVAQKHHVPCAIAGFRDGEIVQAIDSVLKQLDSGTATTENCYTRVVHAGGNRTAQAFMQQVFDSVDSRWRGIGTLPLSGYAFQSDYVHLDARRRFGLYDDLARKRIGAMPAGCACANVVMGRIMPPECVLYGQACTPSNPVGPCMVSDEGACHIWWSSGRMVRSAA